MDPMPPFPSGRDAARTWISKELKARRLTKAKSPGGFPNLSLLVGDDGMPLFPGVAGYRDLMYGKHLRENQFWKAYRFWYPDGARQHLREQISSAAPAAEATARAQAMEAGAEAGSAQFFFTTDATATTAWDSTVEANLLINNDGEFAAAAFQEELQDAASAANIWLGDTTANDVSSTDVVTEMLTGFEKRWTHEQAGGAGAGAAEKIPNDTKKKGTHCGKCSKRMEGENLCSRCSVINYCSRKCQEADRKAHKPRCDK
jgi:hypothetical protein